MTEYESQLLVAVDKLSLYSKKLTYDSDMDSEDLIQETLLKALYSPTELRGNSLISWVSVIMHNNAVNYYRRERKNPVSHVQDIGDMYIQSTPLSHNETDTELIIKEILAAVDSLPKQCQHVLVMRIKGFKYEEIAWGTERTIGTVKSNISRARRLLLNKIKRY